LLGQRQVSRSQRDACAASFQAEKRYRFSKGCCKTRPTGQPNPARDRKCEIERLFKRMGKRVREFDSARVERKAEKVRWCSLGCDPNKTYKEKRGICRLFWAQHAVEGERQQAVCHALAMTRGSVTRPTARWPLPNTAATSAFASAGSPARQGSARYSAFPSSRSHQTCSRSRC